MYICQVREQSQGHPECEYGRCLERCKSAACVQMPHSGLPSQDSPSARRTYRSRPCTAASQNLHTPRGLPPTLAAIAYIHNVKLSLNACARNQVLDEVLYLALGSWGCRHTVPLQLASGNHQALLCAQAWQAVAQGEATLNNTLLGFLGRFDAPFRAPAPAAATRNPSGTQGRRLHQNGNSYLGQGGQYASSMISACTVSSGHHCCCVGAGLGGASQLRIQSHIKMAWHVNIIILEEALPAFGSLLLRLHGEVCAKACAAVCSAVTPATQPHLGSQKVLVPCRLLGHQELQHGRGTHSCTADQVHSLGSMATK